MFKVTWTGEWPCLCDGEWKIEKNESDVSDKIPSDKLHSPMMTRGWHQEFSFDENWDVRWESYEDGLEYDEWTEANKWIDSICDTETEKHELYDEILCHDWRGGECGGCI